MAKLIASFAAEQDLIEIWEYIAEDNAINASRFLRLINEKCLLLAGNPLIGIERSELATNLRSFPVGHYIIFYKPILAAGMELVRVLHASRDINLEFEQTL